MHMDTYDLDYVRALHHILANRTICIKLLLKNNCEQF